MSRITFVSVVVSLFALGFGAWEVREARIQRGRADTSARDMATLERQVENLGKAQVLLTEERDRLLHAVETAEARPAQTVDADLQKALDEANARVARTADALRRALTVPVVLTASSAVRADGGASYGMTFFWDPVAPSGSVLAVWRGNICRTPAEFSPSDLLTSQAADRDTTFAFVRGDLVPGTEICAQIWRNWTPDAVPVSNRVSATVQS